MEDFDRVSIHVRNFKCFGDSPQGFDKILPFNIIIGKNNSGKSTLLEFIENAISPTGSSPEMIFKNEISYTTLKAIFPENTSGGPIRGNHWQFGMNLLNQRIIWSLSGNNLRTLIAVENSDFAAQVPKEYCERVANGMANPMSDKIFRRLSAERDIKPEQSVPQLGISEDGSGLTNLIERFKNRADLPMDYVNKKILENLNFITNPEINFDSIVVQQHGQEQWEIFLREEHKGLISISNTGTGIKTIILALSILHLIPEIEKKKVNSYIYCFEELENNLHPSLIRRLFEYLFNFALRNQCIFFITTHSNIVIDMFNNSPWAQIVHVTHDGKTARVNPVRTYVENRGVLDDLDVRASDLLQSNGIVWVEGPSDRIYFNRWIEIFSEGEIQEGIHYQCVTYGGRLLAHFQASDPDVSIPDLINFLLVNRNIIILMDSDLKAYGEDINSTKERVIHEIDAIGGMSWITAGKEIENYIPGVAIQSLYQKTQVENIRKNQSFPDYLDSIYRGEGRKFQRNKVLFAERVSRCLDESMLEDRFDLVPKINEALQHIRKWNGM